MHFLLICDFIKIKIVKTQLLNLEPLIKNVKNQTLFYNKKAIILTDKQFLYNVKVLNRMFF